ncbi:MAG: hypothetical protein JSS44_04755 [Proteobacteria bacterium]|nr:hypothetical protein [Pseudomonadota bacterium]MBS0465157.1 hypothetical protein [Pseudomonadota bacterium]
MKRSIWRVAVLAACAVGCSGTAFAEKFHYPTKDGGCAAGDTDSLSGGPYNHHNFFPAGGWGGCLLVVNSGRLVHSVLRDPHTGDVFGTVTTPVAAKTAAGARADKEAGTDCKPGQDKGCVLRPSKPLP